MDPMDGFLNINKQTGWTSHDVVARLRQLLKMKKVGHTGTLDPAATGVLPICIGKATRLAEYLTGMDKEYEAVMRLGETTDTLDATGKILARRSTEGLTREQVRAAMDDFLGDIEQIPPMFSAVKVGGQPLYKAARAGREVRRESRIVTVHRLELLAMNGSDVTLRVACSKGTYIRTLCADIGERLGMGAHLSRLRRTRSGPFRIEEALTLDEIAEAVETGRIQNHLLPAGTVLRDFPSVSVTQEGASSVLHGAPIGIGGVDQLPKDFKTGQHVLVYSDTGHLIALAEALVGRREAPAIGSGRLFKVEKVLV